MENQVLNSSSYTISEDKLGAVKQKYNWKTVKLEIKIYIIESCLLGQDVIWSFYYFILIFIYLMIALWIGQSLSLGCGLWWDFFVMTFFLFFSVLMLRNNDQQTNCYLLRFYLFLLIPHHFIKLRNKFQKLLLLCIMNNDYFRPFDSIDWFFKIVEKISKLNWKIKNQFIKIHSLWNNIWIKLRSIV